MSSKKVKNDSLKREIINTSTGEIFESIAITLPDKIMLEMSKPFLLTGEACLDLDFRLCGVLSIICHHFLHFDTMLLYKSKESPGLFIEDISNVLNVSQSTAKRYLKELKSKNAIICPDNSRKMYVNPRFILMGGYFDYEEIKLLIYYDSDIKKCIVPYHKHYYNIWKKKVEAG